MKYIVIARDPETGERTAFRTSWFDAEMFNPEWDMAVVDTVRNLVTFDGTEWREIESDTL